MAAHAAHISGMTTYDEGKHPRGQVGNAGQFRNKSWSDPEAALTASTEPVQPLAATAEAVVFANYLPEDGQTAKDVLQEALNDRVLGADDIMSLISAGVTAAWTPDAIAESIVFAKYLPYDDQTAEDVLWEALVARAVDADDIMSLIRAGVTAAYESRVATPGGQVHSGTPTAPFRVSNRYTLKAISPAGSSKP